MPEMKLNSDVDVGSERGWEGRSKRKEDGVLTATARRRTAHSELT